MFCHTFLRAIAKKKNQASKHREKTFHRVIKKKLQTDLNHGMNITVGVEKDSEVNQVRIFHCDKDG